MGTKNLKKLSTDKRTKCTHQTLQEVGATILKYYGFVNVDTRDLRNMPDVDGRQGTEETTRSMVGKIRRAF